MTRRERTERARRAAKAKWDKRRAAAQPAPVAVRGKIDDQAVALSRVRPGRPEVPLDALAGIFAPAKFPKAAEPAKGARMAMDAFPADWAWGLLSGAAMEGQTFLGYPYLAELSQRPEYRRMVEQLAFHMTRRWIRVKSVASSKPGVPDVKGQPPKPGAEPGKAPPNGKTAQDAFPPKPAAKPAPNGGGQAPGEEVELNAAGEPHTEPLYTQADKERDQKAGRVKELEAELDRLRVRQHFKEIVEHDGFFGRGHIFIDLGMDDAPNELATSIGDGRTDISALKVPKGSLKGLKTVEPVWVYPLQYNANDPLHPGWYRPDQWYVMKRNVHRTRLLTFVGREVPDLLKPAYAFGGVPLVQMAKPYVDNWLRTRQGVSDLVQSFTQFVVKTELLSQIATSQGAAELYKRLDIFTNTRNNRNVMAVDKEREELANVSAPLGSLDKLQAQAQEHMSSVSGIPILFLLGDQPTGLNASSEGAIRAFYDWIHAYQEFLLKPKLDVLFKIAQLSLWGEVDPELDYEFVKLWTPTDKEEAELRKTDADRDATYLGEGVIHADEVRQKLIDNPDSGYKLDAGRELPEPPEPELPPGFGAEPGEPGAPGKPADGPKPPKGLN